MAMRCFGRARLAGTSRPLALSFFRAVDLAAVLWALLRAGDFFCAADFAAARALGFLLAIDALPFSNYGRTLAHFAVCRVGKGALAPCPPWQFNTMRWARGVYHR